jgi:hypothetical protein
MPNKGDHLFYARALKETAIYDVCELIVRTVEETYFVGVDKRDKHAYLFSYDALGENIFEVRDEALKKVQAAEKNKKDISDETYYEEY